MDFPHWLSSQELDAELNSCNQGQNQPVVSFSAYSKRNRCVEGGQSSTSPLEDGMTIMKITTQFATTLLSTVGVSVGAACAGQVQPPNATLQLAAGSLVLHDGVFVGGTYDAYYGKVQVQLTVQGGTVVDSKALKFPNHSGTSRSINRQALPYLLQEVVAKQSAKIDIISGATLTSRAYIYSLRDAVKISAK